jgi:hypothetical protein
MKEKMDCKYFYYYNVKERSLSNPNVNSIQMPRCKKDMMSVGSCRTDCEEYESKIY